MSQNPQPNYRTDVPSHPRVVYEGRHLIVVDKEYDLVINCDNPERPSVAKQLEEKFPLLADPNLQHAFRFVNRCGHSHKLFFFSTNTYIFHSSQQLPGLRLWPLKGFLELT